ncbi:hypothetical protein Fmac_005804 [Flemingia macrophylla]|uniref:Protein arginine N-methyltransferase domain-containing protein n=1 Tax=Flemingia macrophylla TaxID=520843 RepID=A0ABD1N8Y5_9FABA
MLDWVSKSWLVESTFLWKLHDLYNNESNVSDGINLTPPGLDSTLSVKRQQYAMHYPPAFKPFKNFEFDFWKRPESYGENELCVKATNDGRVHAVVSWWVLQLDQEGPSIIPLLLGPHEWCDHWKQCVWFVPGSGNNQAGEQSSPHPKKAQKLAATGKRSRYVIKLPLEIGKSTHTPIVEPRQSQPKNIQSTPSEPENFDSIPPIPSPHLNASPTHSPTQIHSSRASQYCAPRDSALSSPSEPNASPHSIASTRQENVVMQEQTSSEATQPCVPADPPPGAILSVIEPCKDGVASKAITQTVKQQYIHPWLTWGAMSDEEKEIYFEKIFSQAKSEAASCGGGSECSPLDPGVEEKIRNQSWFSLLVEKNKGRVYGVGKVKAGYRCGDNFTQPTTSSACSQKITMLEEKVRKTQEENERLSRKFETFLNVVLPLLLADVAQQIFQQSEENQQHPQQPSPQPSYQAAENQENNDHFPSNYEDY